MGTVTDLRPRASGGVKLQPGAGLDIAQAAAFLSDLDARTKTADPMYLLGQAENHLYRLIGIVRALTSIPAT